MAFTSMDGIISSLGAGNGQRFPWQKQSISTTAARWYSLWKSAGFPIAGANPGSASGVAPSSATDGAFPITNPSGANKLYGLTFGAGGATQGITMLYDRLVATSELSGTVTTAQTINSAALTRYTSGVGVLAALEVYTALGSTSRTATISYTNQDGTAGKISGTVTIPASAVAGTMVFPFPLASGDTGIKSVQSLTLSGTTGTAGNFGVTLYVPIAIVPFNANSITERDLVLQLSNLPQIQSSACLALASFATASSLGDILGTLTLAQG